MAQHFLDQLPKVPCGELPSDAECMICREKYGTVPSDNGVIEHAVRLPCHHAVGSECIITWLSPDNGPGNSCPLCRMVFFPNHSHDYDDDYDNDDEDDDDDDDDDDEGDYNDENDDEDDDEENGGGNVGEDGQDEDGPEDAEDGSVRGDGRAQSPLSLLAAFQKLATSSGSTAASEDTERLDGQQWFERWPRPTSQEIEETQKRAQRTLLRPLPSGITHRSLPQTYAPSAEWDTRTAELASAYRTMAFRETLLYLKLKEAGARISLLQLLHKGLFAHQEEQSLWELGLRGAFRTTELRPGHLTMTNRQSWYVHRARGEVYTFRISPAGGRGAWTRGLSFEFGLE